MAFKKTVVNGPVGKATAAPVQEINLGDLDEYASGGGLPDGIYNWKELEVCMWQPTNPDGTPKAGAGQPRLGVLITLQQDGEDDRTQFYSMGGKAHESFQPNPATRKSLIAIPGGAGRRLNKSTNWVELVKSLYNSGMPPGWFSNNVTVLEGLRVNMQNVPEPEERKSFGSAGATSEAAMAGDSRPDRTIAVVTEVLNPPWEGKTQVKGKVATLPGGPPTAPTPWGGPRRQVLPRPVEPEEESGDYEELTSIAGAAIQSVLDKNSKGCSRLKLKMDAMKYINENTGEEASDAVVAAFFETEDDTPLVNLLSQAGFKLGGPQGQQVIPA